MDSGSVVDTATATGTDSSHNVSPASNPSTATIFTVAPSPTVSLVKSGAVTPAADQNAAKVGDTIAYSYVVTNTGNVTLASVDVSDPSLGAVICTGAPAPGLAPGDSESCTGDTAHTVTQADVDSGSVVDSATATGTDTRGNVSPTRARLRPPSTPRPRRQASAWSSRARSPRRPIRAGPRRVTPSPTPTW